MLQFVREHAIEQGLSPADAQHVELAADEVLTNIIHYAGLNDRSMIVIHCSKADKPGIRVTIKDTGKVFNPLTYAYCTQASAVEQKIGGNGIYLVKQLMDSVAYSREQDMNVLTLVKYRNAVKRDRDE